MHSCHSFHCIYFLVNYLKKNVIYCKNRNVIIILCSLFASQEMDFGTIMCWADNNVGQQKEPCVFHLIAAGKPEAPTNCTVVNQTSDSLEVYCLEGE